MKVKKITIEFEDQEPVVYDIGPFEEVEINQENEVVESPKHSIEDKGTVRFKTGRRNVFINIKGFNSLLINSFLQRS